MMDETLKSLYGVRVLALRKEENAGNMNQLRGQLQNKKVSSKKASKSSKTSWTSHGYISIFFHIYIPLVIIINMTISFLLYRKDGLEIGVALIYASIAWILEILLMSYEWLLISIVLALLPALIFAFIVRAIARKATKKEEKNAAREEHNRKIMDQIADCEQMQRQILQDLERTAPWYPQTHFTVSAVDDIVCQMETGGACSVKQAIAHYEVTQVGG